MARRELRDDPWKQIKELLPGSANDPGKTVTESLRSQPATKERFHEPGVGIVLCIATAIVLGTDLPAMSANPSDLNNMTCRITTPDAKGCTGIPTLRSGVLTILKEGTFELKAHYDGCFVMEDVTTFGKFLVSQFKNTMSLELLSTRTTGVKDTAGEFPRTLGFANLQYDKLDGYFVDFSAVIRARGRHAKDVITSKLQCEVSE